MSWRCGPAGGVGGAAADRGLDRVKLGDPAQRLGGDRRAGRLVHVVELPSGVRPAGGEHDVAACGEPLEARIAVDLKDAAEPSR